MRRTRRFVPLALLALVALAAPDLRAEPLSAIGGHDIGALMARVEERYDLGTTDAVILLHDESIELSPGQRTTTIHLIVWIATEYGLDVHADLRVPHDSETSTLEVVALRTWRDGRWWPHESELNPTAIVETLPYAVQTADDYTNLRETMLLHDGVELPCIIETVYTIVEERPEDFGADGLWVFPERDPTVTSRLAVTVPADGWLTYESGNEAPEPEIAPAADGTTETYTWQMELVDRLPRPLVRDAAARSPYVAWSTWTDWNTMADVFEVAFEEAAVLSDAMRETLAGRLERIPALLAKAEAVAAYVDETTRIVGYDGRHWEFAPRSAVRTWETAYGHRLDRAVLAAALFREAGCLTKPVFRSVGHGPVDQAVPSLERFEGVGLWVSDPSGSPHVAAYYDPSNGALLNGATPLLGRAVWYPAARSRPAVAGGEGFAPRRYELELVVSCGEADDDEEAEASWSGRGYLRATGGFSPYVSVVGLDGESKAFAGRVASSVLEDADVTDCNLAALKRDEVVAGFAFDLESGEPDDRGRTRVAIGDPAGGLLAHLPADVRSDHGHRDSPVVLPGPMFQRVVLRLEIGEGEPVRIPEDVALENAVGRFALTVVEDGEWLTVIREIAIDVDTVPPADWPALRDLLLEEVDPRNRTILLE
jgi:hypothetical protein